MIKEIKDPIREPFWSAGQKYKWEGSRTGIGLNIDYFKDLKDEDYLKVKIIISKETKNYQIQKSKAKELVKRYNSQEMAKGVKLIVLPLYEFEPLDSMNLPPARLEESTQQTLL